MIIQLISEEDIKDLATIVSGFEDLPYKVWGETYDSWCKSSSLKFRKDTNKKCLYTYSH